MDFGEARSTFLQRNVEGVELALAIAQADAEDEIATAQHVERGGFLGDVHRVQQRQQQNIAADGHAARLGSR